MTSLKKINKEIAPLGIELCKGNGYFYFATTDEGHANGRTEVPNSVYVNRLNELPHERWIEEANS